MALAPVAYFSDPLEDYPNQFIKFFEQGTTTPLSMATDSTGATTLAKAEISGGGTVPIGFIKTAGDAIFIPWVDGDYDLWIFPTAAEADANDTSNAIQIANDINSDRSSAVLLQADKRYSALFGSVASMIALTMVDGGTYTPLSSQSVSLVSYHTSIPFTEPQGGGGDFRVMTLAEYALTPDETGAAFTIGGFAFVRDFDNSAHAVDFGAKGVGGANDTTAIQAGLNSGVSLLNLGDASKTYLCDTLTASTAITIKSDGATLKLRTDQTRLFIATVNGVNADGVIFDGNDLEVDNSLAFWQTGLTGWFVRNCTFQNINGVTGVDQYGLKVTCDAAECEINNLTFKNISNFNPTQTPAAAFNGGLLLFYSAAAAKKVTVDTIYCDNIFTDNIDSDINNSDSDGIRIFGNNPAGIDSNLTITNLFATGVQKSGLKASGVKGIQYSNLFVNGTRTDLPMIAGFRWQSSDDSTAVNVHVKGNITRGVNINSSNFTLVGLQEQNSGFVIGVMVSFQASEASPTRNVIVSNIQAQNLNRVFNFDPADDLGTEYIFENVSVDHIRANHRADASAAPSVIRRVDGFTMSDARIRDSSEKLDDAFEFERCTNVQFKDKCYIEANKKPFLFTLGGSGVFDIDFGDTQVRQPNSQNASIVEYVNLRFSDDSALTNIRWDGFEASVPLYTTTGNNTTIEANLIDSELIDTKMIIRDEGSTNYPGTTMLGDFANCTIRGLTLKAPLGKAGTTPFALDVRTGTKMKVYDVGSDMRGVNIRVGSDNGIYDSIAGTTVAINDLGAGNEIGTNKILV